MKRFLQLILALVGTTGVFNNTFTFANTNTVESLIVCLLNNQQTNQLHEVIKTNSNNKLTLSIKKVVGCNIDGLYLDQLISAENTKIVIPHVKVTNPPAFGTTVSLKTSFVKNFCAQYIPELPDLEWDAPESISVFRNTRSLSEPEIVQIIKDKLQSDFIKDKGELELNLLSQWKPINIPDDPIEIRIIEPLTLGPSTVLRFELKNTHDWSITKQLLINIKVKANVYVTRNNLKRGQVITEADVQLEKRDILQLRDTPIQGQIDFGEVESTTYLAPGSVLLAGQIRSRSLVKRGDIIDAIYTDGAMSIRLKVEVLEPGGKGDSIRVRNTQSKREFTGRLKDEQTVVVVL